MTDLSTALLVAAGGGVGAALRYAVAGSLDGRWPGGTLLVNVVGSAVLGLLIGGGADGATYALLGVGFCGGLTTCSALAVQAHRLGARDGTGYAVATIGLTLAACTLGVWWGAWWGPQA